jgi:hypothetical protein
MQDKRHNMRENYRQFLRGNFIRNVQHTHKAIRELLTKFQKTGSVHDDSGNGRPRKSGKRMELVEEFVI